MRERGLKLEIRNSLKLMPSSFPVRERGLKHMYRVTDAKGNKVVPRAGTWIETPRSGADPGGAEVVPRAGTWIETKKSSTSFFFHDVVPRAGTWIETALHSSSVTSFTVVPRAGTWIETHMFINVSSSVERRSPCGNVD